VLGLLVDHESGLAACEVGVEHLVVDNLVRLGVEIEACAIYLEHEIIGVGQQRGLDLDGRDGGEPARSDMEPQTIRTFPVHQLQDRF
jgi:hypothetical protein